MNRKKITISAALMAAAVLSIGTSKRAGAQAGAAPDGVVADPGNYKVLFEDAHIRLVEVVVRPGETEKMHIDPYPLVVVRDAVLPPKLTGDTSNAPGDGHAIGPKGLPFPICSTVAAQPAHAISNKDTFPLHYYRIEYKRVDESEDYKQNWKKWYPWIGDPLKPVKDVTPPAGAKPFSKDFPYPIEYDSYLAAPNNHFLHYEDDHIRFLEVVFRPGERENMHGHPYYSVFSQDMDRGTPPPTEHADGLLAEPGFHLNPDGTPQRTTDYAILLDPTSPLNDMGDVSAPPAAGTEWPRCVTAAPQAPHTSYNGHDYPIHFYRLEFLRLDGDGIKDHWKEWYPWMAKN